MQIVQRRGRTTEPVAIAAQDSGTDGCLIRGLAFLGSRLGSWQLGHGLRSFFFFATKWAAKLGVV
jgi:hypothetical protein